MTVSSLGASAASEAAAAVTARLGIREPVAAIVLGSGLGALADRLRDARRMPYDDVPGFAIPAVEGHSGELIRGFLGDREVIALAGRFHMYEGHSPQSAGFPVRLVHALGARVLIASNAAGGIRASFKPGDLMLIEDHINLMWRNPIAGPLEPGDTRFPDMSAPYSPRLGALLKQCAAELRITLHSGVYAGLLGPSYETPAEVRMLATMGADAVGMSTVPETIVAAAIGIEVAAISVVTNAAAGVSAAPVSHAEVMAAADGAAARVGDLVEALVKRL